jgi:hypothetical protein
MTKNLIRIVYLISLLFFVNCATMFSDNSYTYTVTSNPSNADVTAQDALLVIGKYKTPCKIDVNMRRDTVLKFESKGYDDNYIVLERGINRWFWLSLFTGWPGIIIDYATGSMYKPLKNKTEVHVELNPSQALPATEEKKGKK